MQRSALCRSRRELSNEYLLAKIGVDTAENEPLEVWGKIQFTIHFTPYVRLARARDLRCCVQRVVHSGGTAHCKQEVLVCELGRVLSQNVLFRTDFNFKNSWNFTTV